MKTKIGPFDLCKIPVIFRKELNKKKTMPK